MIASIVEGVGDAEALPVLLRRIGEELGIRDTHFPRPQLVHGSIAPGGIERFVERAATMTPRTQGILVLIDAEDNCPATLGPSLLARAQKVRPDKRIAVVLANRTFETWLIAAAPSIAGHCGLAQDLQVPTEPEEIRNAVQWLTRHRTDGRPFRKIVDQVALTAVFDISMARSNSPSFEKLYRDVKRLLTGVTEPKRWGELIFADAHDSAVVSRAVRRGTLKPLGHDVFTGAVKSDPKKIVKLHLRPILAHVLPGAVIADASVRDGGLARGGQLFVVHPHKRPVELAGVTIYPRPGTGPVDGDMKLPPDDIWMSSEARAMLDNLATPDSAVPRTLTRGELEEWLEKAVLQDRRKDRVNRLLERARAIAPELGRTAELRTLELLIGAARGTRDTEVLTSDALRARAMGEPYDRGRLDRFAKLVTMLRDTPPDIVPALPADAARRRLLPFYEAYFSNFIEGTEFSVGAAADIVFEQHVPVDRPEDAHDILGTFQIVSDEEQMSTVPHDYDELRDLLLARHAVLLARRQETSPGRFKTRANRVGSTHFVAPEMVEGTLRRGFDLAEGIVNPFARAVYMMFLVGEVHPFTDGNGRIARIFSNAELVAGGEVRFIIPTVFRTNYLVALRAATQSGHFSSLSAALSYARKYTAQVDFTNLDTAEEDLARTNAFRDPAEADLAGIRLTLPGHGVPQ